MGYYQMTRNKGNTKAGRKDPRYIEIFTRLRDLEYTIGQARGITEDAVRYMDAHPDCSIDEAIRQVMQ